MLLDVGLVVERTRAFHASKGVARNGKTRLEGKKSRAVRSERRKLVGDVGKSGAAKIKREKFGANVALEGVRREKGRRRSREAT